MRTLVQLVLRNPSKSSSDEPSKTSSADLDAVRDWLSASGFRPRVVHLDAEAKAELRKDEPSVSVLPPEHDNYLYHAFQTLASIPLAEEERHHAMQTAALAILWEDMHGNSVWGLVCIDSPAVDIRWRHRVSRSLERATEQLVSKVWESSGVEKLFQPFTDDHTIPVREPNSVHEAYSGTVLPPGPKMKHRARADKRHEWQLVGYSAIAAALFTAVGFILFMRTGADAPLRWWSGASDRLATTALATMAVSYLQYRSHLLKLQSTPVIHWT
jgi:hypothetical protein